MKKFQKIWVSESGELRFGWKMAAGIAAYLLAFYGVIWLANIGFGALFKAWNLTNENLRYAPKWAQKVVLEHTDLTYILAYCASADAVCLLTRGYRDPGEKRLKETGRAILMGLGLGAVLTMIAFALDSMRLERPLSEPMVQVHMFRTLAVLLVGIFSREVLTKRLVFCHVNARFGRVWSYAAVGFLSVLLSGMWTNPVGLVNALLMGIVGCAVYERGGLLASEALAVGWSAWTTWLFAWPGAGTGVYQMYTVSDAWLTGGNAGANCGILATVGWITIAALLLRKDFAAGFAGRKKRRNTNGKDSHCNRRSGLQR